MKIASKLKDMHEGNVVRRIQGVAYLYCTHTLKLQLFNVYDVTFLSVRLRYL